MSISREGAGGRVVVMRDARCEMLLGLPWLPGPRARPHASRIRLDVSPMAGIDEELEVPCVHRGDDNSIAAGSQMGGLGGEDHIAVNVFVARSRSTSLARCGPVLGGRQHDGRRNREKPDHRFQSVKPAESTVPLRPQQLTPYLVIGNLRNQDAGTARQEPLHPVIASARLSGLARVCDKAKRARVEQDDVTHGNRS